MDKDYYVDPLEQEALMKEKLAKIEARKKIGSEDVDESLVELRESMPEVEEVFRPDMNVSGYFSAGNTSVKRNLINRPISRKTAKRCFLISASCAAFSLIYLIALFICDFVMDWRFVWLFIIILITATSTLFFAIRSNKSQDPEIKRSSDLNLILAISCFIPLLIIALNNLLHFA